jgi:hypothetical protein
MEEEHSCSRVELPARMPVSWSRYLAPTSREAVYAPKYPITPQRCQPEFQTVHCEIPTCASFSSRDKAASCLSATLFILLAILCSLRCAFAWRLIVLS